MYLMQKMCLMEGQWFSFGTPGFSTNRTDQHDIWRIMTALKIETDIIVGIAASALARAVILVIVFVETFKIDIIVFIGSVILYLM